MFSFPKTMMRRHEQCNSKEHGAGGQTYHMTGEVTNTARRTQGIAQ